MKLKLTEESLQAAQYSCSAREKTAEVGALLRENNSNVDPCVLHVVLSQFEQSFEDGSCLSGSGAAVDCLAGRNGAAEAEGGASRADWLWYPAPRTPGSVSLKTKKSTN